MELKDYLRAARRRWWILVLIPLLAVVVVVGLQLQKPASFTATATVSAPALVGGASSNQYSGSAGPKTFVANFQAVLTSPNIIQKVSDDLKVPKSKIGSGLTSTEVGLSSVMQVTYTGPKKANVGPIANDAARQSLLFLFQTQVDVAKQPVIDAQAQLDSVNAQLASFAKASGTPVPDRDYQVLATEISQLEQTQAQASATNNAIEAGRLDPELTAKRQQLAQLAGVLSTYLDLKDKQTQASSVLNSVNQTYQQARAQFAAANPEQVITLSDTQKVSLLSATLPAAGVAFGSALAFAVGIVFLLEAVRRRRRVDEVDTEFSGAAAPSVPAAQVAPVAPVERVPVVARAPAVAYPPAAVDQPVGYTNASVERPVAPVEPDREPAPGPVAPFVAEYAPPTAGPVPHVDDHPPADPAPAVAQAPDLAEPPVKASRATVVPDTSATPAFPGNNGGPRPATPRQNSGRAQRARFRWPRG